MHIRRVVVFDLVATALRCEMVGGTHDDDDDDDAIQGQSYNACGGLCTSEHMPAPHRGGGT